MELKIEELTDEVMAMQEKQLSELADLSCLVSEPNPDRIGSILERAQAEQVIKDSSDFVVNGLLKGLEGIADTVVKLGKKNKEDDDRPKRSY